MSMSLLGEVIQPTDSGDTELDERIELWRRMIEEGVSAGIPDSLRSMVNVSV